MPSMILPLMTGLILFFSGIVIGYLFTYRDRSDEEALQDQLGEENKRLKQDLDGQKVFAEELQDQTQDRQAKLVLLQQLCDDSGIEKEQLNQQCRELEQDISSGKNEINGFRQKLSDESQRRAETDDLLHELKQKHVKDLGELEGVWREKLTLIESQLAQRNSDVERLSISHDRISEQLQRAETKIAKLESEIESHQSLLETAKNNANGLEKEYVTLETSMGAQIELLNESRGQVAAANSARNLAEQAISDLRSQYEEQQSRLNRAEELAAHAETTKLQCVALEQSLESSNHRIEQIIAERDSAMSAEKQALTVIGGVRKRNENQEMTIRSLREQCEHHLSDAKQATDKIDHIQMALDQAKQVHMLNAEDHAATQRALAKAEEERSRLEQEFAQAEHACSAAHQQIEMGEENRLRVEQELELVQPQLEELNRQIEASTQVTSEFQSRLDHLVQQRDQAFDECESLREELRKATINSASNEETIRNLRRERGAILLRSRQVKEAFPRLMPEPAVLAQPNPSPGQASSETRLDPVRGVVYTKAPESKDDLKRISGIAEVLETRLNEFGIYTYKQIMDWNQTAIDEFSVLLTFKDRIVRDDWKGQAERFYKEKTDNQQRAA